MCIRDRRINSSGRLKINHNQTSGQLDETWLSIFDANSGTNNAAHDQAGVSQNYSMINLHNYGDGSPGNAAGIGFGAGSSYAYTKGSIAFERRDSYGRGVLVFCTNNDADTTLVNATDERLRIGQTGRIDIGGSDVTGYSAHSAVDDLVVGGTSSHGITVLTGNSSTGNLWFDSVNGDRGYIQYAHNEQALILGTENNERLRIDSSGRLLSGTTTAGQSGEADALTIYKLSLIHI